MFIDYSEIPGSQKLFLDYIYDFDTVKKFYEKNFREIENYADHFSAVASQQKPHKDALVSIIKNQYSGYKLSKQTESNIEAFHSGKTIAIITGQQLGLFGGPMYTIYKTMTAIKLCRYLKEKFETYHFVPVFWLEGDDHDFEEIRSVNIPDSSSGNVKLLYDDGKDTEINRGSMGYLDFNENIEDIINKLDDVLIPTEFKKEVIELIKSAYGSGTNFSLSFRKLLYKLFDEYGLVIFNPVDSEVKKILTPVFENEIENFRIHADSVVERSAEVEEIYHAQVKVKPINLFLSEKNERFLLEPVENDFRLKGKRIKYSKDEVLNILRSEPERFGPNVLLRPICQDYLFPTGFYIAGPSEISYFSQVMPLYDHFKIVKPIIYPRGGATIVEKNTERIIEKYGLSLADFFITENSLIQKVVAMLSSFDIESLFDEQANEIQVAMDRIKEGLFAIDNTLTDSAIKTEQKIIQSFNQLKNKAKKAEERKHETAIRQLNKVRQLVYPNGNLQEREINFIYFANKYGLDILKWIFDELKINKFEHQIINI